MQGELRVSIRKDYRQPPIQTTKARAATLHLPHGPVQLPMFMPVATQASLKGLTPEQLEETGCRLCLNNTYHLWGGDRFTWRS